MNDSDMLTCIIHSCCLFIIIVGWWSDILLYMCHNAMCEDRMHG